MAWIAVIASMAGMIMLTYGIWQMFQTPSVPMESLPPLRTYKKRYQWVSEEETVRPFKERVVAPLWQGLLVWLAHLAPSKNIEKLDRLIVLAGRPHNLTVTKLLGLKVLSGIVTAILVFVYTVKQPMPFTIRILVAIMGGIVGLYLPDYLLKRSAKKRKTMIMKALPDALDMLMVCVDAGLGFDAALQKVSDKWDNPLAREFGLATLEMNMGLSREEALRHIIERTDVPEVATFIAVLIQAYKLGIGIGHVLHQQSQQLRIRRRQWAEEEAHKAPIKMLIPLALFIFPAIFVVIIGPAIPRFLTQFPMH